MAHAEPNWLDTLFCTKLMKKLNLQQWVDQPYDIMRKNYFSSCTNKLSSIKCKAFEIGKKYLESKLKLLLEVYINFNDTNKSVIILI